MTSNQNKVMNTYFYLSGPFLLPEYCFQRGCLLGVSDLCTSHHHHHGVFAVHTTMSHCFIFAIDSFVTESVTECLDILKSS